MVWLIRVGFALFLLRYVWSWPAFDGRGLLYFVGMMSLGYTAGLADGYVSGRRKGEGRGGETDPKRG